MLLENLLPKEISILLENGNELDVSSIEIDSRKSKKNSVFFALKGRETSGLKFVDVAIEGGATVVVCDEACNPNISPGVVLIKVKNPHELLVFMLGKLYNDLPANIIGVTGTNGKTSVAEFGRQILENLGIKAATIGTLGVNLNDLTLKDKMLDSSLTTPDLVSFYKNLSALKKGGVDFVLVEASSIGLEQGRLNGVGIKAGVFTNFTQDHLDYHQNMDNYFDAKMILFRDILSKSNLAVINSDSDRYEHLESICKEGGLKTVSYGKNRADFQIVHSKEMNDFREISLLIYGKKYDFNLVLLEYFQAINVVCALATIVSYLGLDGSRISEVIDSLDKITPVCGRMEKVAVLSNNAKIYIDFAHTPDALENILRITKKNAISRVLVVVGCGGDRDSKKRPLMGKIAENFADLVFITDDNPRGEDPAQIRKDILSSIKDKTNVMEIGDRKSAIKMAISCLQKNDILIIAGKGHEKYQIIGKDKHPFDEQAIVRGLIV